MTERTVHTGPVSPVFHFLEKPGPHYVGLNVVEQYDYSRVFRPATDVLGRSYHAERARPIQTLIWYPADHSGGKPMTVENYVELSAAETRFGNPEMSYRDREWLSGMQPTLALPLWAVRDASPSSGRFPVVIYAPSFSAAAWENADFCEYLASHGYLVIAAPSMGAMTRAMTSDLEGLEAQARDISFLIGYACALSNADLSGLAVAGFSWGGLANLLAAARDGRINALLALDGSMRYWSGLLRQAAYVQPRQMTIPLIYFAQGALTLEDQERYLQHNDGPNVLNSWAHGDLTTVHMLGMSHAEFGSMFQRNENLWWQLEQVYRQKNENFGRDAGAGGYAWVARYAREFLDAYLKHDSASKAFLQRSPAENGVPRYVMKVDHRPAAGRPATFETFRAELGRQGFDRIVQIHAALKQQAPDFQLDEGLVISWAEELMDDKQLTQAVALLNFNTQIHPDSTRAYTNLGDAYRICGQLTQAAANYRRAIEQDATNADAIWKLSRLPYPATE